MVIISWKPIYETNITALDNEHRELIAEINRLYEAIRDKRSEEVVGEILDMVQQYTVDHFQHEEKLMAEYAYPGLEEQQLKHQELILAVQKLKTQEGITPDALAKELFKFLKTWVLEHIVQVDKKYGAYLESRGGRFIT